MSKDCNHFKPLMQTALDGKLAGEERTGFARHLEMCQGCRAEFRAFQLGLDLLAALPVPEPGPGFTAEILKKAMAAKQRFVLGQRVFSWTMAFVTLLASALLVVTWFETTLPSVGRIVATLWHGLMEGWVVLCGLVEATAALITTGWALLKAALPFSPQGLGMLYVEIGMALAVILSLAAISKLRRAATGTMIFSL